MTQWALVEARSFWLVMAVSFLVIAVWESLRPHRPLSIPGERRWSRHGLLLILSSVASVGIYRIGPVVVAAGMAHSRFGFFHLIVLPYPVRFVAAILLLDFAQYAVHWTEHHVPILWRMHQVHHSDPDFDLSTGARVHPIETVLVQGATLAAVALLAPPVAAVLTVELAACFQSFFAHANVSMPVGFEKYLRRVMVTPQMHRVHHSENVLEQKRNLADIFPWWDHLFRTYLAAPTAGDEGVVMGMEGFQNSGSLDLWFMLSQPFRREVSQESSIRS
jgi:sterol desaturase/sphingolipid hydroxylase (fatty acid hydroxylase superfamily)